MAGVSEFVKVKRLIHGDEMVIVKWVAEKYPHKFEIIEEEKPKRKKRVTKKKVEEVVNELPSDSAEG